MLSATMARLGSWCGVAAGLTLALPAAVEAVTGETAATSFVLGVSPALAIPRRLEDILHALRDPLEYRTIRLFGLNHRPSFTGGPVASPRRQPQLYLPAGASP